MKMQKDISYGSRLRSPKLMVISLFSFFSIFHTFSLGAEGLSQEIGVGFESGFGYHQDKVFTQQGNSNIYTAQDSGNPYFSRFELGPSFSWDVQIVDSLSLGIRSTVLLFGASFPYNFVPRFNARITYSFIDWFSATIEFPYSPGVGLTFIKHYYLFIGTDAMLVPKSDYMFSMALLYQFSI